MHANVRNLPLHNSETYWDECLEGLSWDRERCMTCVHVRVERSGQRLSMHINVIVLIMVRRGNVLPAIHKAAYRLPAISASYVIAPGYNNGHPSRLTPPCRSDRTKAETLRGR